MFLLFHLFFLFQGCWRRTPHCGACLRGTTTAPPPRQRPTPLPVLRGAASRPRAREDVHDAVPAVVGRVGLQSKRANRLTGAKGEVVHIEGRMRRWDAWRMRFRRPEQLRHISSELSIPLFEISQVCKTNVLLIKLKWKAQKQNKPVVPQQKSTFFLCRVHRDESAPMPSLRF